MYSLIRPLLFQLDAETAHDLAMNLLHRASQFKLSVALIEKCYRQRVPELPVECMGIKYAHPIGLAAGLDKDAKAINAFSAFGFSAVELGTVTLKPQAGNDKPRMFRLAEDQAIINRMGFNSAGVEAFLANFNKQYSQSVVGINVGKNAATNIADAHFEYAAAIQRVYQKADYITVNISSPNTKSLRDLQNVEMLEILLSQIKKTQSKCLDVHKRYVPIALKVAPDLSDEEIGSIADLLLEHQFDGLIASNTTVSRPDDLSSVHAVEAGGLSGEPVKKMSTEVISKFYRILNGEVPIIGVGGIANADDAWEKMLAGADFLQLYSQFIYQGPGMIAQIVKGLSEKVNQAGYTDLTSALKALR